MEIDQIKTLISSYFKAGQPELVVADMLANLNLNGQQEAIFDYLHSTYAIKESYIAKTLTDTGNAERLVKLFGDEIRYCYDRKKWLIWNGVVWEWDDGERVMQLAKDVARNIYAEAADEKDDKKRDQIAKHAHISEGDSRRKAMIELAQCEIGMSVQLDDLNANSWLLNCANGSVNLKTGELLSHSRKDLNTLYVDVEYSRAAKCDRWLKFLDRVTDGNHELIEYLQKAVGYSLTGDTREQCLFFLYGLGRNGKSTFLSVIRKLMGEYGTKTSTDLFMAKDRSSSGPNEGLADLQGKRFVVASEIEDGRRLAVVLIKEMTGGESIRADRKYEHQFEFQPTHKIWLSGNHKPIITDTTYSIWRRFKLIPFTAIIPDSECDPLLALKLEEELSGILAWAVQGCLAWRKEGLVNPQKVTAATESYRQEQDLLGEFIDDNCLLNVNAVISKNELYTAYKKWAEDNNQQELGQRNFRSKVVERGIIDGRGTGGVRIWRGITLVTKQQFQGEIVTEQMTFQPQSDTKDIEPPENQLVLPRDRKLSANNVSNVTNVTKPENDNFDDLTSTPCPVCSSEDWQFTPEGKVICGSGHIQSEVRQ